MTDAAELPLRDGNVTMSRLIDLYMANYTGRDRTRVQRLAFWDKKIGTLTLAEVNDDHLHVAMEALAAQPARVYAGRDCDGQAVFRARKEGLSPATLNRYLNAISAVFTYAVRKRICPKGWDHPGQRMQRNVERNARVRFLSPEERVRLLAACKASKWPRLYVFVLLALTTGARKSELLWLRWRDVDLDRRVAHLATTKNHDARALPLTAPVVELLQQIKGDPAALLFASARRPAQPYAIDKRWYEAMRAARIRNLCLHGLRHTCASYLAQSGASALSIGDLLGHRTMAMVRRYAHHDSAHRLAMVDRVLGDIH